MKKLLSLILLLGFTIKAQEIKIGTQTWTTKNLDVSKFRNGEAIPLAKTNAEWELAGQNQQPAWCYYEKTTTELVYQATDGVNKADSIVIAQAIIQLNSTVIA